MLIGRLCHTSTDFGIGGFPVNSWLAVGNLMDGSQNAVWLLVL